MTPMVTRLRLPTPVQDVLLALFVAAFQLRGTRLVGGGPGAGPPAGRPGLAGLWAAGRHRPGRLPHPAGGGHQRHPPRRPGPGQLELLVADDGRGPRDPDHAQGTGRGIAGMGERATLPGGELTAGPGPAGGFQVRARLPLPPPGAAPR